MYSFLPGIGLPEDTDLLWRYMSFEKFVSLLNTKSLFFTRADKFDDPFEGFTHPLVKRDYESSIDTNALVEFQKNLPKYALCSCWHHAEEESIAMWEKYHMQNSGIAIKTTFSKFKDCLKEDYRVFLGKIEYIDHYAYPVPQNISEMSMFYTWYFHKRKTFEYEREFRAIFFNFPRFFTNYIDDEGNFINRKTPLKEIEFEDICNIGMSLEIDINRLICEVIISPYNRKEEWILDTVRSVINQYGFDIDVNVSRLLDEPDAE